MDGIFKKRTPTSMPVAPLAPFAKLQAQLASAPEPIPPVVPPVEPPPLNPSIPVPVESAPVAPVAPVSPVAEFTAEQQAGITIPPKPVSAPVSMSPEENFMNKQNAMYKINK